MDNWKGATCTALVALMALGVSCSQSQGAPRPQGQGQMLTVDTVVAPGANLDPVRGQNIPRLVNGARLDTLLVFRGTSTSPQPWLATSYTVSDQNQLFTFKLRKDVLFADGTPLTADDVVFTYLRTIGLKQDGAQLLTGVTVSAPDSYTVVLNSDHPNAAIPANVAAQVLGIVNSKLARAHGATSDPNAAQTDTAGPWFNSSASQGAGSGPYMLVDYVSGDHILMGLNTHYWGPKQGYAQISIRNIPSQTQAINIQRGTSEVALDISSTELPGLSANKDLKVVTGPSPTPTLFFSNNNPAISAISSNKHLQQAIRYAIDYTAIMKLAGQGAVREASVTTPSFPGSLQPSQATKQDLTKAKAELGASGLSNPSITIEYPSPGANAGVSYGDVAQIIQSSLAAIGIRTELKGESGAILIGRYLKGQIPWGLVPAQPSTVDVTTVAAHLPGGFLGKLVGWQQGDDPALEALAKAAATASGDNRLKLWMQVEVKMNDDGPWIGLFNPVQAIVAAKDVSGVVFNPGIVLQYWDLRPAS
jgi:peptide/nickel transport system substrate-binding protein